MLAILPRAVRITYDRRDGALYVNVHDAESEEFITCDTLGNIAAWLELLEFEWVVGSNGCWERS